MVRFIRLLLNEKCRFLWSAHRITERQKAGKARNIKEKQLKNSRSTVSRQLVVLRSSQRDNFSRTKISRKAHFSRVTEIVECCQMCWNLHRMQHICSRYATKILICIGHFSVEILGNVLFFLLNRINRIYKLLYIKVGIYFLG